MGFNDNFYEIEVEDQLSMEASGEGKLSADCLVFVYDAGTKTLSTIYSDDDRTALTNPISRSQFGTDEGIKFYSGSTSHDLVIAHSDGSVARYASVGTSRKSLYLNRDGVAKHLIIPFSASTSETDTGIDLPYGVRVEDVQVEVVTVDATEDMDVGLLSSEPAGDADGFINGVSVANAGYIANEAYTVGSNDTYLSASTNGALMGSFLAGADTATDTGTFYKPGHVVTGSNAVSVTYTGSAGTDTAAGYIHIFFRHLR